MHTRSFFQRRDIILWISFLQAALIIVSTVYAMTEPGIYARETPDWRTQSIGQDMINGILISPLLVIYSIRALQRKTNALYIWSGIQMYLLYTFIIYAFDVHFNNLFLLYCTVLGISFYSLLWHSYKLHNLELHLPAKSPVFVKVIGFYLIMTESLFMLLWLSEIIPAMVSGLQPAQLADTGLLTSPVHVLDISVVLPAILLTAIALLKKKRIAYLLASSLLTFTVLMNATIAFLMFFIGYKQLDFFNTAVIFNMLLLCAISLILLKVYLRLLAKYTKAAAS